MKLFGNHVFQNCEFLSHAIDYRLTINIPKNQIVWLSCLVLVNSLIQSIRYCIMKLLKCLFYESMYFRCTYVLCIQHSKNTKQAKHFLHELDLDCGLTDTPMAFIVTTSTYVHEDNRKLIWRSFYKWPLLTS